MEDSKAETDAGKVSFIVDYGLINSHLLAVSKDKTRVALTHICFEHKDGALHIMSCDGRVLFHTTIPDGIACVSGGGDWVALMHIPSKLKGGVRNPTYVVEVDGNIATFTNYAAGDIRLFTKEKGVIYPKVDQVENFKSKEPTKYNPFDPKILLAVHEYVGRSAYCHPVCADNRDEAPYQFTCSDREGVVRRATIMPIRK